MAAQATQAYSRFRLTDKKGYFLPLTAKAVSDTTNSRKTNTFLWVCSLKLLYVTLDNLALLFCRIPYFNVTAKRKPPCYTETVGGENSMKKQQVEYKVNIIGETELSEWSDEIVELLVEMFIGGYSLYIPKG